MLVRCGLATVRTITATTTTATLSPRSAQGMGDFWADLYFGDKLPRGNVGHTPAERDRFLQGPIAQHCEEWARKLEAWPKPFQGGGDPSSNPKKN